MPCPGRQMISGPRTIDGRRRSGKGGVAMRQSVRTSEASEGWEFSMGGLAVALAVTGIVLLATRGIASADLRVCNNSGAKVDVAIAYVRKDAPGVSTGGHAGATVEGWWSLSPAECAKLSS